MKKLKRTAIQLLSLCLAVTMLTTGVSARSYNDKKEVLNTGYVLDTKHDFAITNPPKNTTTTASEFFITGSSNPHQSLTCNGEKVSGRGMYGTFGVYVSLKSGKNTFTFKNGSATKTVTITRSNSSSGSSVPTISNLRRTGPDTNDIVKSGEDLRIRCTAPANAKVEATLGSETIQLKQEVAASTGVEAYYSGHMTMPSISNGQHKNLGKITYRLQYKGKSSSAVSGGSIYLLGNGASIGAKVNQNAAVLYEKGDTGSTQVSTVSRGAVGSIVDSTDTHYKLSMGCWVLKNYVDIQGSSAKNNTVSSAKYGKTKGGEQLILDGTAAPVYKGYNNSDKIIIKLYNTTGVKVGKINSALFSAVHVNQQGSTAELVFVKKNASKVIGYDINYKDGNTMIYFNTKPQYGSENQPLKNMTIVVDPGHGGVDSGAVGVLAGKGPMEKHITMAQGLVLKNRLESLGAKVIMTVKPSQPKDKKVELNDRVEKSRKAKADLFISLHCNSISAAANGLKPSGTEIYYYEGNSKALADKVLANITSYNNRPSRGVKYSNFYVNRNPLCPSMLIEMGFVSNPAEYDELCSPNSLYNTANAIADAIISYVD